MTLFIKAGKYRRAVLLIIAVCLCSTNFCGAGQQLRAAISIHGQPYSVEVAATPKARARGLMFRRSLAENTGMLFVYPEEDYRCFYMKNTFVALDIAFISKSERIVDIRQMEIMDETPVCSRQKAQYALEVNRGFFTRHKIQVGDKVEIKDLIW